MCALMKPVQYVSNNLHFLLNMTDQTEKAYNWEADYEKTWEAIVEDEHGSLKSSIDELLHKAKRRQMLERPNNVKLGMMRHLYIIVDQSVAMEDQDLRPTRFHATLKVLERFVDQYFDHNPISQLGVLVTKNKRAERVSELGGNPRNHIAKLRDLGKGECKGEASLQNALEMALQDLKHMPGHVSREVLIVFGSLTTCDPGDLNVTIKSLLNQRIRASIIGLAAEVRICRKICHDTGGHYHVILDEEDFLSKLKSHVTPPPAAVDTESSLIRMGFPQQEVEEMTEKPAMCMCHLDGKEHKGFTTGGYFCPQCRSKYCELPVECRACSLTLVSAPHLTRSHHHLFPLPLFTEVQVTEFEEKTCCACQRSVTKTTMYKCDRCTEEFCVDCDVFIHDDLHACPGCASSRDTQHHNYAPPEVTAVT